MSHISESLPQKEIVVTVILDSNDVREKISGCDLNQLKQAKKRGFASRPPKSYERFWFCPHSSLC